MIQKLPIFFPPISNCYSACSGVASILQAYDNYNPDLFLNRLYLFRKANNVLKFATIEKTNETTIINYSGKEIVNLLIKNINNKDYVFLRLNHFYISKSSHFNLYDFIHDVALVYGYDSDKRVFYCADNFYNGKYLQVEVPYVEIEDSWSNLSNSGNDEIIIFHYNESVYKNQLDFQKIYLVMQDYIESSFNNILKLNPSFLFDNIFGFNHGQVGNYKTCVFGIKIYDWLLDYLKSINIFDLRPLHLLMNHQEILLYLIEYMQRKKRVVHIQKYIDILKKQKNNCEIARNLAIKYNVLNDEELRKRILDIIARVYHQESTFYSALLSDRQIWK